MKIVGICWFLFSIYVFYYNYNLKGFLNYATIMGTLMCVVFGSVCFLIGHYWPSSKKKEMKDDVSGQTKMQQQPYMCPQCKTRCNEKLSYCPNCGTKLK